MTAIKVIVSHFAPVTITSLRIFLAFITLSPILFFRKGLKGLSRRDLTFIGLVAVSGVLGHHFFLSVGLSKTSAANGGLILGSVPVVTTLAAALFLGDRLSRFRIAGLVFGFAGVAMIVLMKPGAAVSFAVGDLYMMGAVLAQAVSFILINKMSGTAGTHTVTGLSLMMGAAMLFTVSTISEPDGLDSLQGVTIGPWLVFLASGVVATAFGHLVYNYAIQRIGAGQASLFLNLSPFFSLVGAALFLGETIYPFQWAGFLFIVAGVVLGTGVLEHRTLFKPKIEPLD